MSGTGGGSTKRPSATPGTPPPAMTSGNESEAPSVTGSTPQNGENKPPQAIVKPQVLTHVIEGFVIQEGAEPFPVCVSARPRLYQQRNMINNSEPPRSPVYMPAGSCQQENTNPLLLLAVTAHTLCLIQSLIMVRKDCVAEREYRWMNVCEQWSTLQCCIFLKASNPSLICVVSLKHGTS